MLCQYLEISLLHLWRKSVYRSRRVWSILESEQLPWLFPAHKLQESLDCFGLRRFASWRIHVREFLISFVGGIWKVANFEWFWHILIHKLGNISAWGRDWIWLNMIPVLLQVGRWPLPVWYPFFLPLASSPLFFLLFVIFKFDNFPQECMDLWYEPSGIAIALKSGPAEVYGLAMHHHCTSHWQ